MATETSIPLAPTFEVLTFDCDRGQTAFPTAWSQSQTLIKVAVFYSEKQL